MTIVSGDKDLIQLTDEHTVVLPKVWLVEASTPDFISWKKWASHQLGSLILRLLMGISLISLVSLRSVKKTEYQRFKPSSLEGVMKISMG